MRKTVDWLHWLGSFGAHLNYIEKGNGWQLIYVDSVSYVCPGGPGVSDFDNGFYNCKRVVPSFSKEWRVSQCYDRLQEEETSCALTQ